MIELTEEQRKKIYEEEKAKREEIEQEKISPIATLITLNIISCAFLTLLLTLSKYKFTPKINLLRKAYEGLSPEDKIK